MILFQNNKYQLLFSNQLPMLLALNYADELFFQKFEELCGFRYRILSVIKNGWQQKFGRVEDLDKLKQVLLKKIEDGRWVNMILSSYDCGSVKLRGTLRLLGEKNYQKVRKEELVNDLELVRGQSALLDAMSNLLHLFSVLIGHDFLANLRNYSGNPDRINKNFIFYTQPIRESRLAKINLASLQNKIELSESDKNLSNIIRIGAFIKDDVSELLDLRKQCLSGLFKVMSDYLNCAIDDVEYLQVREIREAVSNNFEVKKLISGRRLLTVMFYSKDELEVFSGADANKFLENGNFKEVELIAGVKELRGQTASLGKVSGRTVVAQDSVSALKMMKAGDILVAPYTAVEYLPAMKKASAIITETGGITSHAAIISRELGIPCVIGIDGVTKILKTGDIVEVDGDEGVVKIL